ncbi:MAG: response regulator [Gammaproteobacteria bacterium]|nr:response regulator [Gammaproteobacteria bacterium]
MDKAKSILIVDDSKVSRMMLVAIIKDHHPDWHIQESGNAEQAIEVNQKNDFDYYSIDFNMPGKNGIELISVFKTIKPSAKYALLTANIQEHIQKSAAEIGAKCINKPITNTSVSAMLDYFNG